VDEPARGPRGILRATLVIGAVVFYALAVETVGFFITAPVFLAVLFGAFGVRRRWIVPLAAGVTLTLHFAFYTLLRVPLPWGWLEGMAW
jgi:putative tricarboxylic transport membrane protein